MHTNIKNTNKNNNFKKHKKRAKEIKEKKPGLGKLGTTVMASEMAFNLGSPLKPFSAANIFPLRNPSSSFPIRILFKKI